MKTKLLIITLFTLHSSLYGNPFHTFLRKLIQTPDAELLKLASDKNTLVHLAYLFQPSIEQSTPLAPKELVPVIDAIYADTTKLKIYQSIMCIAQGE